MKFWKKAVIAILLLTTTLAIYLLLNVRHFTIEQVTKDIHIIRGIGGNTTILNTNKGTVVVDSMTFKMQGSLIRAKAKELTGKDVVLLINTHYHLDHTHGNPAFDASTQVVSTERTLSHLKALDASYWQGDDAKLLPNETFNDRRQFDLGNKTVTLIHPGRGHTDGDLVVLFEEDKILATGDLFFNKHYPFIDLEAGGSVSHWPTTLDSVLALKFDIVIPGHGETSDRAGLINFQTMIREIGSIANDAINENSDLSLKAFLNAHSDHVTSDTGYSIVKFAGIPLGFDREFVLTRAWQEKTQNFELKNKATSN